MIFAYLQLCRWGGDPTSGQWVQREELMESIFNLENVMEISESTCNTRKETGRAMRRCSIKFTLIICFLGRHTVGLQISAWPCGVIPDFGELYGSESIQQVIYLSIETLDRIMIKYVAIRIICIFSVISAKSY
jgi:hypothetical protein